MADSPDALIEQFKAAFLTKDVDAIMDCYEDDATYVAASFEIAAHGHDEIRGAWAGLVGLGEPRDFEIHERPVIQSDDYAFAHMTATATLHMNGEDTTIPVRATEVMHRGVDGQWRYVIDHA